MGNVTVDQWKEIFAETGLSEEQMQKWHTVFEKKNPDGHQRFLEWLGLEDARIAQIRQNGN